MDFIYLLPLTQCNTLLWMEFVYLLPLTQCIIATKWAIKTFNIPDLCFFVADPMQTPVVDMYYDFDC